MAKDYTATLWLGENADPGQAVSVLTGALHANQAVIDVTVDAAHDEENPAVRWVSVEFNWDVEASARIDDDFTLDALTDQACAGGLFAALTAAGIKVTDTFDEHR